VIHDRIRKQLYFHNARFEIGGVPVFYFHRLRLPDPALDRATGFLIPKLKTSTDLATGVKIPYFITLGDHADLLMTPYFSSRTSTIEGRVRRQLSFGSLEMSGAVSEDRLGPRDLRGYLFAEGRFFLSRDYRLNLDLQTVSDDSYLLTYGYSDADAWTAPSKSPARAATDTFRRVSRFWRRSWEPAGRQASMTICIKVPSPIDAGSTPMPSKARSASLSMRRVREAPTNRTRRAKADPTAPERMSTGCADGCTDRVSSRRRERDSPPTRERTARMDRRGTRPPALSLPRRSNCAGPCSGPPLAVVPTSSSR